MLDRIIKIGTVFDWITPVISLIQDWQNGPSIGLNVPVEGGYSAYAIKDILAAGGIKIWGLRIIDTTIIFRTKNIQAAFAQYLLERAGVPYQGGISEADKNLGTRKKATLRPEPVSKGWLDNCLDGLNKFVDGL